MASHDIEAKGGQKHRTDNLKLFLQLCFGSLERINFGFTTTSPDEVAITELWLNNSSTYYLQITRLERFIFIYAICNESPYKV